MSRVRHDSAKHDHRVRVTGSGIPAWQEAAKQEAHGDRRHSKTGLRLQQPQFLSGDKGIGQELSIGTIKNRMAVIRWWSQKDNKQNMVTRANEHYGIPDRRFITNDSKARTLTRERPDKERDVQARMSLELQQAFGLRYTHAQNRHKELTGWKCPTTGGPERKSLTPEQRETDRAARLTISRELGHDREAAIGACVGR